MSATYEKNFSFSAMIEGIEAEIAPALQEAMKDEEFHIQDRTRSGLDVNEQPFAPYSPAYAKYKAGRERGALPGLGKSVGGRKIAVQHPDLSLTVDLTLSGEMLLAMQTDADTGPGGTIVGETTFNATSADAKVTARQKAVWNEVRRPFFGYSSDQIDRIRQKISDAIARVLGK